MQKTRIGQIQVELVLTDEMRQKLMELATGSATTVVIPQAVMRRIAIQNCTSDASRLREVQYRRLAVDRLELSAVSGHVHVSL